MSFSVPARGARLQKSTTVVWDLLVVRWARPSFACGAVGASVALGAGVVVDGGGVMAVTGAEATEIDRLTFAV